MAKKIQKIQDLVEKIKNNPSDLAFVIFSAPISKVQDQDLLQSPFPIPTDKKCIKIKIRPSATTSSYKEQIFFAEFFTEKQTFHRKINVDELAELIIQTGGIWFKSIALRFRMNSASVQELITVLSNKKGQVRIIYSTEKKSEHLEKNSFAEFKNKNYILQEGKIVPFLVRLGIMTQDGTVVNSKRDKFKQVNKFLEFVADILPELKKLSGGFSKERPLKIIDFGCGKSYLTFALHFYFSEINNLPVEIIGLDLKEEVILECERLATSLSLKGITFIKGDIAQYANSQKEKKSLPPDLMVSLHACDTATDYAIEYAIKQGCLAILSVPCCQHEANSQLEYKSCKKEFKPLLKHGLIKERFASLVTDALRVEILEQQGYSVQVLEFIDMSHTPKNILIRAVRSLKEKKQNNPSELAKELGLDLTLNSLVNH